MSATDSALEPTVTVAELNRLFLALVDQPERSDASGIDAGGRPRFGLHPEDLEGVRALPAHAKARLAAAPVALFTFAVDARAFRARYERSLDPEAWLCPVNLHARHALCLTALFGAWQLARRHPDWLELGFGLAGSEVELLRELPLSRLPELAPGAAATLSARFASGSRFWPLALRVAGHDDPDALRIAALASLHLAGAELTATARAAHA